MGYIFSATKVRIGSVALLETDPLGPTGTRVLIIMYSCLSVGRLEQRAASCSRLWCRRAVAAAAGR